AALDVTSKRLPVGRPERRDRRFTGDARLLPQPAAVDADRPDFVLAAMVRIEGDTRAIGGKLRQTVLVPVAEEVPPSAAGWWNPVEPLSRRQQLVGQPVAVRRGEALDDHARSLDDHARRARDLARQEVESDPLESRPGPITGIGYIPPVARKARQN